MEALYFIADWILNIIGGALVVVGVGVLLFFMGAGFFGSSPSKGFVEDAVAGGVSGCAMTAVGWFICMVIAGFGAWLIQLL